MRKQYVDRLARQERLAAKQPRAHQRRVEWRAFEARMEEREEEREEAFEAWIDLLANGGPYEDEVDDLDPSEVDPEFLF